MTAVGRRLFIGATEQHSGKTTMSVCLTHLARQHGSVGYMKPVGQEYVTVDGREVDKDVALLAAAYGLQDDLPYMSPVVAKRDFTKDALDGKIHTADLVARILSCLAELERRHDLVIIEGTGHGGVGSVFGLSNARVARVCDARVLVVCRGGIGSAVDSVALNLALYAREGADVRFVLANKLLPEKREQALDYMRKGFAVAGETVVVVGGLDYSSVLANPTLTHVAKALRAPLAGDPTQQRRIVGAIQLGAASTDRCIELLETSTLLVFPSTRDELLVTCSSLYPLPEYNGRLAGLVISGLSPMARTSRRILDSSGIPYVRVERRTGEVFTQLMEYTSKTGPDDAEKIAWIQKMGEQTIDWKAIAARL